MMKTNLSGIKDVSTINGFIYGLDAKTLITYLDCLLNYVQNDPSLMQMGLTRVSLVQPYNVWGLSAKNQVVLGLTSQKAIYGFEEISHFGYASTKHISSTRIIRHSYGLIPRVQSSILCSNTNKPHI